MYNLQSGTILSIEMVDNDWRGGEEGALASGERYRMGRKNKEGIDEESRGFLRHVEQSPRGPPSTQTHTHTHPDHPHRTNAKGEEIT